MGRDRGARLIPRTGETEGDGRVGPAEGRRPTRSVGTVDRNPYRTGPVSVRGARMPPTEAIDGIPPGSRRARRLCLPPRVRRFLTVGAGGIAVNNVVLA